MIKQKKRWVLVADGARARIFLKTYGKLENALDHDFIGNNLDDTHLTTDKPGRNYESASYARHSYQPRTDWHQYQETLFSKEICSVLETANERHEFDELILICPPKTLGTIRANLNKHILPKITAEFPKDLTKFSESELVAFLEKEF